MKNIFKHVIFRSEPKQFYCPKCGKRMNWNTWQGPLGGWYCECGLKIDYKG